MSRTFEIVTELSKISIVGSLKSSVKIKSNLLSFLMSSSSFTTLLSLLPFLP